MRQYNKIYLDKNKQTGSENIILGYKAGDTVIEIKPDAENSFHMPYFINEVPLNGTPGAPAIAGVSDGATPGPFPAAADRIYENRKGYGNSTTNGNTSSPTGDWNCSWLDSSTNKWIQRTFDGKTFVDSTSVMTLSPGVQYKYVRVGEKSASLLVDMFAGPSESNIKLNLENWNEDTTTVDTSPKPANLEIIHNGVYSDIFTINTDAGRVPAKVISFNNNYNIDCYVPWQPKYSLTKEFTWNAWAKSNNWQESPSTQLFGNFSADTGIGLFIDTLSSYPFFVIPAVSNSSNPSQDTGHLLYINEALNPYYDKLLFDTKMTPQRIARPEHIVLDSDNNVVVLATDKTNVSLRKYDAKGNLLRVMSLGFASDEKPLQMFCTNWRAPGSTRVAVNVTTLNGVPKSLALAARGIYNTNTLVLDTEDVDFTTITAPTTALKGLTITGTGIPANTTISAVAAVNTTTNTCVITLSNKLTANIELDTLYLDTYIVVSTKARYFVKNNLNGFFYFNDADPDGYNPLKETFSSEETSKTAIFVDPQTKKPGLLNLSKFYYLDENEEQSYVPITTVLDLKCIDNISWAIGDDGNLYQSTGEQAVNEKEKEPLPLYSLFYKFEDNATAFNIDPYNRLWVLHGTNKVSVFDSSYKPIYGPLFEFESGFDTDHQNKNISFICMYERATTSKTWRALIYYGDEGDAQTAPQIYVHRITDGKLYQTVDVTSGFNPGILKSFSQSVEQFTFNAKGDFTGYDRRRIFNNIEPYNGSPQLVLKSHFFVPSTLTSSKNITPVWLEKRTYPFGDWGSETWHQFTIRLSSYLNTSNDPRKKIELYLDSNSTPVVTIDVNQTYTINNEAQPPFYIGAPCGGERGFNNEIQNCSAIFNGVIEDVKIYDYALNPKHLVLFRNKTIPAQPMYWTIPTPNLQYTEQIERMFKHKLPGAKSTFFNIKINGSKITDPLTRTIIEEEVRKKIENIKPMHTDLLRIVWED